MLCASARRALRQRWVYAQHVNRASGPPSAPKRARLVLADVSRRPSCVPWGGSSAVTAAHGASTHPKAAAARALRASQEPSPATGGSISATSAHLGDTTAPRGTATASRAQLVATPARQAVLCAGRAREDISRRTRLKYPRAMRARPGGRRRGDPDGHDAAPRRRSCHRGHFCCPSKWSCASWLQFRRVPA